MANNLSDTIYAVNDKMFSVECEIASIQKLFYQLGLQHISDRLISVTLDLHDMRKTLHEAVCKKSQEDFRLAEQSSKNVLAAAIAGAGGDPTLLNLSPRLGTETDDK